MNTIKSTYINALLADATYAKDLFNGATLDDLKRLLTRSMTPTLAKYISDNFEVVSHKETDDSLLGSGSGFDATVWRGLAGGEYANKVYVSMQGTLGEQDFLTDEELFPGWRHPVAEFLPLPVVAAPAAIAQQPATATEP